MNWLLLLQYGAVDWTNDCGPTSRIDRLCLLTIYHININTNINSGVMGGDNERSEAGTAPAWLSSHHQQQGDADGDSSTFATSSSASSAGRKKPGPASAGLPSRCMSAIEAHSSGVNDVVFEKGGVLLATAGDDSYVKVWDPGSGRQRAVLKVSSDTLVTRFRHV